jgi:SET and MYND domain-containing protein 4
MPVNKISRKSAEKAEHARNAGNKFYVERCFFDAILKYNESLCYAITGSEAIGLAFANRSAVYFEMKLFEKSLMNIELAKVNGYPEKNFFTLDKRAQKCVEQIKAGNEAKKDENPFEFIKLSCKSNPKLPFVADCLELKSSEKFGRYIVTRQDLKVGDVVAIETPKFKVIKSDPRYESCQETNKFQRCAFCLKDNLMDLITCESCVESESNRRFVESFFMKLLLKVFS